MTDIVTKVSIWGQVVPIGWGSAEWAEVVYLTQAEYDVLPASKLTDGKIYKIKTSGVAPTPTPSSESFANYINNTPLLEIKWEWSHNNITMPEWATFVCLKYLTGPGSVWYTLWPIAPLSVIIDIAQDQSHHLFYLLEDDYYNHISYNGDGTYNVSLRWNLDSLCVF